MICGMTASTPVTVSAPLGSKDKLAELKALFAAERERARKLKRGSRWSVKDLPSREAAARRAEWEIHKAKLQEHGQLVDTRDVLVAYGVRLELKRRGWGRKTWPPLPREALTGGRWPGSRDVNCPDQIPVRLPSDLVLRVRSACWHTSAPAIALLRDWRDAHPSALPWEGFRSDEEHEALAEYEHLAAEVTTAGEIWRAGLKLGLTHAATLPLPRQPQSAG